MDQVMTDSWEPYEHFVPPETHIPSKAATFTVEGYHSLFRHSKPCWDIRSGSDGEMDRLLENRSDPTDQTDSSFPTGF